MLFRLASTALCCAALAALVGCATELQVGRNFDPIERFPAQATWRWEPESNLVKVDPRLADIGLAAAIEETVAAELTAHGYMKAGSEPPDYLLSYQVRFSPQERVERSFTIGSLSLQLRNAKHGGRVWVAFVQTEVDVNRTEAERRERLRGVVKQMFEEFPPGAKR
jgi:hypothetical protein